MRKLLLILFLSIGMACLSSNEANAQCSICTKTAQQLGEQPAKGMNSGIIYLGLAPFAIAGFVIFRWKKNSRES